MKKSTRQKLALVLAIVFLVLVILALADFYAYVRPLDIGGSYNPTEGTFSFTLTGVSELIVAPFIGIGALYLFYKKGR